MSGIPVLDNNNNNCVSYYDITTLETRARRHDTRDVLDPSRLTMVTSLMAGTDPDFMLVGATMHFMNIATD